MEGPSTDAKPPRFGLRGDQTVCERCAERNPAYARFCMTCGERLLETEVADRRKLATFVFCDLVGSTAMGDEFDVESVREVMFQYFAESERIVERHGGVVEKFIGDAILAVFGLPTTREDDALRAVRAAVAIQSHIDQLNVQLDRRFGRTIELRIGVNSGEFIVGGSYRDEPLVAGDVANVAARLEQTASPGDILIGETTYRMTRRLIHVQQVGPLDLRGKPEPILAYRVLSVSPDAGLARQPRAGRFVGRQVELEHLRTEFQKTVAAVECRIVTLTADAGLGKTRLASEFAASLENDALVLTGACRPHGDALPYRPILDMLAQIGPSRSLDPADGLDAIVSGLVDDEDRAAITRALGSATGLAEATTTPSEIAWATRRVLESLALRQPVVIVLDDLHWADPSLVEVLGAVNDRIERAPVLVLLLSRPHPSGDELVVEQHGSIDLRLKPLSEIEASQLIEARLGGEVAPSIRDHVVTRAGGNPLFVEELVSMLVDDGILADRDRRWEAIGALEELSVPPTIEALLDSRLDSLSEVARLAIERAAIEGQTFHRHAVATLMDGYEERRFEAAVQTLVDRDLIVDEQRGLETERVLSFRHPLIREVAYRRTPKRLRADLHERFAAWLEQTDRVPSGDVVELVGHHLEQAHRYRVELFRPGPAEVLLAARAASKLEAAGQQALARSELRRAIGLLRRSGSLLGDEMGLRVLPLLGAVLGETGELDEANLVLDRLIEKAAVIGSEHLAAQGQIEKMILRLQTDIVDVRRQADIFGQELKETLERRGHMTGLSRFWQLQALVSWNSVRCEDAAESWRKAGQCAKIAGDRRFVTDALSWQASAAFFGPMPADAAIDLCTRILDELGDDRLARAQVMLSLACLHAMAGRRDRAVALVAESDRTIEAIGPYLQGAAPHREAYVSLMGGRPQDAERRLTDGIERLDSMGEHALLSTNAALLAHALIAQERLDDAMAQTVIAEQEADDDDIATHIMWRTARARVLAARGERESARLLGRTATELAGQTDSLLIQGDAMRDLAEVAAAASDPDEATKLLGMAAEVYERKGHIVGAGHCRVRQAALRSELER